MLTDAEIERIARGLIARDLPKSGWTHAPISPRPSGCSAPAAAPRCRS